MALDFMSKVVTTFKADTSDLKSKLKDLQEEEKRLAKAQLEAAEQRNKSYDDWLKRMANINQSLELAGRAIGFAKDAFKTYAEDLRLKAAAGAVSIDRLKAASLGLREETDLLRFAAQTQHGVFKVTEDQMVVAQRAMVALTRAGYDQEEVTQKVTDALVKGKAKGLDAFGLSVKKGKTDVEDFNNLMEALAAKAQGVDEGTSTSAESIQRMGVTMADAIDSMKGSIGKLVASLAPLLEGLATTVTVIAEITAAAVDFAHAIGGEVNWGAWGVKMPKDRGGGLFGEIDWKARGINLPSGGAGSLDGGPAMADVFGGGEGSFDEASAYSFLRRMGVIKDAKKKSKWSEKELHELAVAEAREALAPYRAAAEARALAEAQRKSAMEQGYGRGVDMGPQWKRDQEYDWQTQLGALDFEGPLRQLREYDDLLWQLRNNLGALQGAAGLGGMEEGTRGERYARSQTRRDDTYLSRVFGPIEEFRVYQDAFMALGDAVGASYAAIVTGAEPAGAAFKKMLADSLLGIGQKAAVESLRELAYAAGSLALGNIASATLHTKAAGLHAGVALAAGVAAKTVGPSAQASAAAKSGDTGGRDNRGSRGSSGSASGSDKERPVVVVLGNHFDELSPRQRAIHAREGYERAMRERDE